MSCPTELTLSIYADGELPIEDARRVQAHVEGCAGCQTLFSALEQENAVLIEVLGEEQATAADLVATAPTSSASTAGASASGWVWGAVAAALLTPFMLEWLWQATPSLPAGLRWIGNFGGLGGAFSLSRSALGLIVGGQDMLVSSFGFAATLFVGVGALGFLSLRRPALLGAGAAVALVLFAGLGAPSEAHAAEFRLEEEGTVKVDAGESIDDTVFLGGKTAIVAGTVDGDVFAAAERVEVTGSVTGNLYSAGESVSVAGEVGGNVHAAGKNVEVDAKVGGTGFLAGQNVTLAEGGELRRGGFMAGESVRAKGTVGRALHFAAESTELSGRVERYVRGFGNEVSVSASSSIGGDLHATVTSEDAVEIDDGATIGGETTIDIHEEEEHRAFMHAGFYFGVLAKTLALLLIGLALVALFPTLRPTAPESSREVLRDMGIGFIVLLATPVAALMIALTLIGIPISLVLAAVYALLLFLSTLVVAYLAAQRFSGATDDRRLVLFTGITLLAILFLVEIPFVGAGLGFLIRIFGLGCLALHLQNLYLDYRSSTDSPTGEPGALPAE